MLAAAIGNNGISTDNMVFVMTPSLATKARVLSGPWFQGAILSSSYIPAGTVIALVPAAMAVGYQGVAEIETSTAAVVMDDTAPPPVGSPGTPNVVGAPTLSGWQSGLIVIKVRGKCAWCIEPGAVSVVTGASWWPWKKPNTSPATSYRESRTRMKSRLGVHPGRRESL
jgi:hypothetical protein